jgi:hypothetical protein
MNIKAIMKRKRSSHKTPLLTIDEGNKLIQRAIVERMNHRIVNQKWTRETISDITNTRVQNAGKAFITNFWEKYFYHQKENFLKKLLHHLQHLLSI